METSIQQTSGPSSNSLENQLLEEREGLKNDITRMQSEHKKMVESMRSGLEKDVQNANDVAHGLRQQVQNEQCINQELARQLEVQTQKTLQARSQVNGLEEQNSRLTTEKNNLLLLLENSRMEVTELRNRSSHHSTEVNRLSGEVEMLKSKLSGKDSEIELVKISERSLKSQSEQLRTDLSGLLSTLFDKDKDLSRQKADYDRRLKDSAKQVSEKAEELWQEKRKMAVLEENLRIQTQQVSAHQTKCAQLEVRLHQIQEETTAQNLSQQAIIDSFKGHLTDVRNRNEHLEEGIKAHETLREEMDRVYKEALAEAQGELDRVISDDQEKGVRLSELQRELDHASDLLAYLKHDSSRTVSPELQDLLRNEQFSVPRLYHEYRIAIDRLTDSEKLRELLSKELEMQNQTLRDNSVAEEREEALTRMERELRHARSELQEQFNINQALEKQNGIYRRNLRMLELDNKLQKDKSESLEEQLSEMYAEDVEEFHDVSENMSSSFRNPRQLIHVNTKLSGTVESLSKENERLRTQLEAETKNREDFAQAVEQVRTLVQQKDRFENRMTELAREIQLYRMQSENLVVKEFLRFLSSNADKFEAVVNLSRDEVAMLSCVRAYEGEKASNVFNGLQKEISAAKDEGELWHKKAEQMKAELENLQETAKLDRRTFGEERDKALNEITVLRNQLQASQQEVRTRAEEAGRHVQKLEELYERVCASERENGDLFRIIETKKDEVARLAGEVQSLKLDNSALKNQLKIFTDQQAHLQETIRHQSEKLQQAQLKDADAVKELRTAQGTVTEQSFIVTKLQEELTAEKKQHEATKEALNAAKKESEELSRTARQVAVAQNAEPPPSVGRLPTGSDMAANIIRQASAQQTILEQQIAQMQVQFQKSVADLAAKNREMEALQQDVARKTQEMNAIKASMLNDINQIKDERETLRTQVRDLKLEKLRLAGEQARVEELGQRQKEEYEDLMTRYLTVLQTQHASVASNSTLRVEIDQLKVKLSVAKKREQDLTAALDEVTKAQTAYEAATKEEIRLLQEERDNSRAWKINVYDRLQPSGSMFASASSSDEVVDLRIVVEHQRKELELVLQQLQKVKDESFATAAKVKSQQQSIAELQNELYTSMQRRELSRTGTGWHESYVEQQAVLTSTLEVNAKLRLELTTATKESDRLRAAGEATRETLAPLNAQLRQVEQEKTQLQQETKSLKEQLESWNARFGVSQQKSEIDSLKRRNTELEKTVSAANAKLLNQKRILEKAITDKAAEKTKELAALQLLHDELKRNVTEKEIEIQTLRGSLAAKQADLEKREAANAKLTRSQASLEDSRKRLGEQLQSAREETSKTRDELRQKTEQLIRFSSGMVMDEDRAQEPPLPHLDTAKAVLTPSTSVIAPHPSPSRPAIHAAPAAVSKSTAVVTPQAQTPIQNQPSGSGTHMQRSGSLRLVNPPIVAVAPQAQEQQQQQQQMVSPIPHLQSSSHPASQQLAVEGSMAPGSPDVGTSANTASTSMQGISVGGRRRPADEESPIDPKQKRMRVLNLNKQMIQLRPPSPTSSDVTSSTNATNLAVETPISAAGEWTRGYTAPSAEAAAGSSCDQVFQEQEALDENVEERAVDSSAGPGIESNAQVADSFEMPAVDGDGDGGNLEGQYEEQVGEEAMDADESGQPVQMLQEEPVTDVQEVPEIPAIQEIEFEEDVGDLPMIVEETDRPDGTKLTVDNSMVEPVAPSLIEPIQYDETLGQERSGSQEDPVVYSPQNVESLSPARTHSKAETPETVVIDAEEVQPSPHPSDQVILVEPDDVLMDGVFQAMNEEVQGNEPAVTSAANASTAAEVQEQSDIHQSGMGRRDVLSFFRPALRPGLRSDSLRTSSATTAQAVGSSVATGSGSPQRAPARRPISPPRQSGESESVVSGAARGRTTGLYMPRRGTITRDPRGRRPGGRGDAPARRPRFS